MAGIRRLLISARNENPTILRLHSLIPSKIEYGAFDAENGVVLRWGTNYSIENAKCVLNSATAIKHTRRKLKMLALLRRNGVCVPKEITLTPCVARWNRGSRGTGLRFCKKDKEMQEAENDGAGAFLEWIQIKKEYRIHIFRDRVISICEKRKTHKAHKYIRSVFHGWKFCEDAKINIVDVVELISSALAAVHALKLDFGAVDIAMSKDNIPVVFEVNTAPGLDDRRAKLYAKAIIKWQNSIQ